jgi:hypothetical protein
MGGKACRMIILYIFLEPQNEKACRHSILSLFECGHSLLVNRTMVLPPQQHTFGSASLPSTLPSSNHCSSYLDKTAGPAAASFERRGGSHECLHARTTRCPPYTGRHEQGQAYARGVVEGGSGAFASPSLSSPTAAGAGVARRGHRRGGHLCVGRRGACEW